MLFRSAAYTHRAGVTGVSLSGSAGEHGALWPILLGKGSAVRVHLPGAAAPARGKLLRFRCHAGHAYTAASL
ncbi:hypothetical protein [Deinococcus petrolearius]|uniref:Uncharacterized protein n=1 Tax=Deinococcus petrolearius TaxID=1751295 RepID=A0ABW1DNG7_9DEIO